MRLWSRRIGLPLFFLIQIIIIFLIVGPIHVSKVEHLEYLSIILSFLFSLIFIERKRLLITIGLLFVVCADFFLVPKFIIGGTSFYNEVGGVLFFNVAQLCFFGHIILTSRKDIRLLHIIVRAVVNIISIVLPFIVLRDKVDCLSVITIFYLGNFLVNIAFSFVDFKTNPIFTIGLILFLLCDFTTGLYTANASGYLVLDTSSWLYRNVIGGDFNFVWFFYAPGITLIASTVIKSFKGLYIK